VTDVPGVPVALAEVPLLPPEDLPCHVAIIMDGNRRWARERGLQDFDGHAAGVETIRGLLQHAVRRGVPMLTLYAFSRENWARSDDEVAGLFQLLGQAIRDETDELRAQGVQVRLLGRLEELPDDTRTSIGDALQRTAEGTRLVLNIAWNYAGRTEIVDAFRRILVAGIPASNFLIWQSAYAELVFSDRLWPDFGPDAFDEALLEFARRTRRFGR
jgi:undecaprenyl diphosphate synthase